MAEEDEGFVIEFTPDPEFVKQMQENPKQPRASQRRFTTCT